LNISVRFWRFMAAVLVALATLATPATAQSSSPQTVWRLLDYVAVDYGAAIQDGMVVNEAEYAEMVEFSATIRTGIAAFPATPVRARLLAGASRLEQSIAAKADPAIVAKQARMIGGELLAAYPVPLAPRQAPDRTRGAALYAENCASCHGSNGNGLGPASKGLDPAPIAFTDAKRARERSLFALYQVIDQGLDGTAMQSFASLPADDRWALAFHAGTFAFDRSALGERLWNSDPSLRKRFPNLAALTSITPAALAREIGQEKADALSAYLRLNPAVVLNSEGALQLTRQRLGEALTAYRAGDRRHAEQLALSAYLDGFEPVEPVLSSRDAGLMNRIERAMGALRAGISRGESAAAIEQQINDLDALFSEAEVALAPQAANDASTFAAALTILLREGLEALLIVIAMIAFLRKADRPEVLPYVHGGWVAALVAGAATWAGATYLIDVSGAGRELTEGFGAIFAALVLVSVGIWMHGKSQADAWQRYIREKMSRVLSRGSAWFLFGLAFLVVYREVFETILFYAAMWNDGPVAVLTGAGVGAVLLGIIAWLMLRYSRKLPVGQFFRYSSALIAVLAIVLVGKGIAAIQEAGLIDVTPLVQVPRIELLGLYPSVQVVMAQAIVLAILVAGFIWNQRKAGGQ
jgi:high-affinity iron transporter